MIVVMIMTTLMGQRQLDNITANKGKITMFTVKYNPVIGSQIKREFDSHDKAIRWCRQIGKPELIDYIIRGDIFAVKSWNYEVGAYSYEYMTTIRELADRWKKDIDTLAKIVHPPQWVVDSFVAAGNKIVRGNI
jgi:hypothetical protein